MGSSQIVGVGYHLWAPQPVSIGVVQGSVLGPQAFLMCKDECLPPKALADDFEILRTIVPQIYRSTFIIYEVT